MLGSTIKNLWKYKILIKIINKKKEEENEKFKKDNPEEYQKMIIKRKEKLLLKKKKRKISIVVSIIGVLVIGVTKGPPIGYLGIAVVMYLIEKSWFTTGLYLYFFSQHLIVWDRGLQKMI